MATARAEPGPLRSFLRILWRAPLFAVPFALFFGTLYGAKREVYRDAYLLSLHFSFVISLFIWGAEYSLLPRILRPTAAGRKPPPWTYPVSYAVVAITGTFAAAMIANFTFLPGWLGNARAILLLAMFAVIFCALIMGIVSAVSFYRQAIDQAKAEEELHLARRIQRSFLLTHFPRRPRFEVHAVNLSSKQVSGDFYDVVPAGDGACLIAIADVAGKGVPAALMSSMLQASLRTQALREPSVAAILENINTLVYRSTSVHQFATFFLARLDERTLRLDFSNAGHNHPIVFRKAGGREMLERGGVVVGILEDARFEQGTVSLEPGDRLVLYTDGVTEAASPRGELYGEERLYGLVASLPQGLSSEQVTDRILAGVRAHLEGADAGDDITLMVLRVLEPGEAQAV
jgi:stage II sporulation SpoE-like protein